MAHRTEYIILKMTPFRESSLIVSGVSPGFGRLDFMLRNARSKGDGKKNAKFQEAALFREFEIEFTEPKNASGFSNIISYSMTAYHDDIALNTKCYFAVCAYASYLLKNTKPMLEMPLAYAALRLMMCRMEKPSAVPEPWHSLALMAFLAESGTLPRDRESSEKQAILDSLLQYAVNPDAAECDISESYMKKISEWIHSLAEWHERNSN